MPTKGLFYRRRTRPVINVGERRWTRVRNEITTETRQAHVGHSRKKRNVMSYDSRDVSYSILFAVWVWRTNVPTFGFRWINLKRFLFRTALLDIRRNQRKLRPKTD